MSRDQSNSKKAPTILVVDDESEVLRIVGTILNSQGYETVLAKSAATAIIAFERMNPKPDLILTDVVMPGMSGPMMVDHLLSLQSGLRVLFMSGYDERQVVQRYVIKMGFSLISKPFSVSTLSASVKAVLEGGVPVTPDGLA